MGYLQSLSNQEMELILKKKRGNVIYSIEHEEFCSIEFAYFLGEYYHGLSNTDKAIKYFSDCISLYEDTHKKIDDAFVEMAREWYVNSWVIIGHLYYDDFNIANHYEKAFDYFYKAANDFNDPDAQNMLGCMYFCGQYVQTDYDTAMKYFEKSAKQMNVFAQNSLGRLYEMQGEKEKALEWYKTASEQGDELATENFLRLKGNKNIDALGSYEMPVVENATGKLKYVSLDDILGEDNTDFDIRKILEKGLFSGPTEYHDAIDEFNVVADMIIKKECMKNQEKLSSDETQAVTVEGEEPDFEKKLKKAEKGNAEYMHQVAICYEKGIGVKKDIQRAIFWYDKAYRAGDATLKQKMQGRENLANRCSNIDNIFEKIEIYEG